MAGTILRHTNSRWRRAGNLDAKTADIHIKMFGTLELSFHFLEKYNYIIDFLSNDLTSISTTMKVLFNVMIQEMFQLQWCPQCLLTRDSPI